VQGGRRVGRLGVGPDQFRQQVGRNDPAGAGQQRAEQRALPVAERDRAAVGGVRPYRAEYAEPHPTMMAGLTAARRRRSAG
jgi:hypothetical protein